MSEKAYGPTASGSLPEMSGQCRRHPGGFRSFPRGFEGPPHAPRGLRGSYHMFAIVLPAWKAGFRARFRPDSSRESFKIGHPAGRKSDPETKSKAHLWTVCVFGCRPGRDIPAGPGIWPVFNIEFSPGGSRPPDPTPPPRWVGELRMSL